MLVQTSSSEAQQQEGQSSTIEPVKEETSEQVNTREGPTLECNTAKKTHRSASDQEYLERHCY